jgi:MoaA/NifB/PqqE/SkfB family radical SAM enzyme
MAIGISILRTIERALARGRLSGSSFQKVLSNLASNSLIKKGEAGAKELFKDEFGVYPPEVLLISPTKYCNLRCKGCYADSEAKSEKLKWDTFDRIVQEAHDFWGARFFVFSGGEPLIYRDNSHNVLDIVEKYSDCYFMMYTNATLIDDKLAKRMGRLGNVMPAISVEGMKERTDDRRGQGVFDQICAAMERLRREKVLFGISMTATRENCEEVLSDEVINFYFEEMGALFGWIFHYMPIGRAITLDLLPTPEQRLWMWKRAWSLIKERQLFLVDFWNGGTASNGCIGAGREGGYMTIDWNGYANVCVFMPYSPVNMNDAYASGKTLIDVWANPFFERVRDWQRGYGYGQKFAQNPDLGNWIMPCPIRDHFAEFYEMYREFMPQPNDENAAEAVMDPAYREGMKDYNRAVGELLDPIWEKDYLKKTN